jgi:hypothetical protein
MITNRVIRMSDLVKLCSKCFNISVSVISGIFSIGVDDDSLTWVNGTLVPGLVDNNINNISNSGV